MVYEAPPSRRLGDKACCGCWASGSPQPWGVWRPPYTIRRHLGVAWRRGDAYRTAADTRHESARGQGKSSGRHKIDRG
jgi:hypothetical protein